MVWGLTLLFSTLLSMALMPLLIRVADSVGLIDRPDHRKVHTAAVPRVGGIAIVIASALPVLLWVPLEREFLAILLGSGVLVVTGIYDDRSDLDYRIKFVGQIAAALIVALYGGVVIERVPFSYSLLFPDYIAVPLTVLVLVAVTNAINLADGLDGLAGGTTLLAVGVLGMLCVRSQDLSLALIALSVFGSLLGFLRYNSYPALVFMGDTGSQYLGFLVGALTIVLTQQSNPALSPIVPLLLFGFPIVDTLAVFWQRIREGRSPFAADKNHLHHKLMAVGLDHYEAVIVIYVLQSLMVTAAYFLRYESDTLLLSVFLGLGGTVALATHWAMVSQRHLSQVEIRRSGADAWVKNMRSHRWLHLAAHTPRILITAIIPVLLVGVGLLADFVQKDVAWFAGALLLVSVLVWWRDTQWGVWFERLAAYFLAAVTAYYLQIDMTLLDGYHRWVNIGFIAMVVGMVGVLRFSGKTRFSANPLDFLVLIFVVAAASLSVPTLTANDFGAAVFKFVTLCYAIEILLGRGSRSRWLLRTTVVVGLIMLLIRGGV